MATARNRCLMVPPLGVRSLRLTGWAEGGGTDNLGDDAGLRQNQGVTRCSVEVEIMRENRERMRGGIVNLSDICGKTRDPHEGKPLYSGVFFLGLASNRARIGSS